MDDKEQIQVQMDSLLKEANALIERAAALGDEHGVRPNLGILNIDDDMWYVSEDEYYRQRIEDLQYEDGGATQEALADLEEEMKDIRDNGGYDNSGYKVVGWMSSSTNC